MPKSLSSQLIQISIELNTNSGEPILHLGERAIHGTCFPCPRAHLHLLPQLQRNRCRSAGERLELPILVDCVALHGPKVDMRIYPEIGSCTCAVRLSTGAAAAPEGPTRRALCLVEREHSLAGAFFCGDDNVVVVVARNYLIRVNVRLPSNALILFVHSHTDRRAVVPRSCRPAVRTPWRPGHLKRPRCCPRGRSSLWLTRSTLRLTCRSSARGARAPLSTSSST
jgi:hypothetical protein